MVNDVPNILKVKPISVHMQITLPYGVVVFIDEVAVPEYMSRSAYIQKLVRSDMKKRQNALAATNPLQPAKRSQ
jgi:Arc/MetJ-type ribon-helix-helix transcriptional regulator